MSVFMCPICDEPLTSPPPNYEVETAQAQELTGEPEPVVVIEVSRTANRTPPQTARRGRALGTVGLTRTRVTPKKQEREAKSSIVGTPCGHLFHHECINQWFKTTNPRTCPTCRKPCQITKMNSVFPVLGDNSQSFSGGSSSNVYPSTSRAPPRGSPQRVAAKIRTILTGCEAGAGGGQQTDGVVEILDDDEAGPAAQTTSGNQGPGNMNPGSLEELRQTHNTLMQDYEELQTKFHEEEDKNAMSQAMINSLETVSEEYKQEIESLKNELEGARNEIQKLTGGGSNANGGDNGNSESTTTAHSATRPPKRARMSAGKKAAAGASSHNTDASVPLPVLPPAPPKTKRAPPKKPRVSRSVSRKSGKAKASTADF